MGEFMFPENTAAGVLERHQKQLDVDGVEVGVSRQALDEVLTELNTRTLSLDEVMEVVDETEVFKAVSKPSKPEMQVMIKMRTAIKLALTKRFDSGD